MAAPMGTFNFFTSGAATPGTLMLSASSIPGGITGTLNGVPITAVWDETSQILSFSRATAGGTGPSDAGFTIEVYTGTLFQPYKTPNGLVSGEGVPLTLAGNFGTGKAGGTVGPFTTAGWFATNTIKFKEKEGKETKDAKDIAKDHKDGKEKDGKDHKDKEPADFPPILAMTPASHEAMAAAMQTGASGSPQIPIATGQSFIPEEERPQVGGAALTG